MFISQQGSRFHIRAIRREGGGHFQTRNQKQAHRNSQRLGWIITVYFPFIFKGGIDSSLNKAFYRGGDDVCKGHCKKYKITTSLYFLLFCDDFCLELTHFCD
jgi:hypothetical protein